MSPKKSLTTLALTAAVVLAPVKVEAATVTHPGPVRCNAQRCVQYRTRDIDEGHTVVVRTSKRTAPVESRTPSTHVLHWSQWRLVSIQTIA